MMNRECNKCIHHTSGMCDSWECKMQTVEDVKKKAVKEYVEAVVAELESIKTGRDCRHKCKYYDWSVGSCEGHCEDYVREKAIEIVREGVRNERRT